MCREDIENEIAYEIIPDIMNCRTENSAHNKKGEYGFNCGLDHLKISFEWTRIRLVICPFTHKEQFIPSDAKSSMCDHCGKTHNAPDKSNQEWAYYWDKNMWVEEL